jgi:sulfur carrier protein
MQSNPQIRVNGEPRPLVDGLTVQTLLQSLALGARRVAVEVNGEIIPRSRHGTAALQDGDDVLIVQAIGGG